MSGQYKYPGRLRRSSSLTCSSSDSEAARVRDLVRPSTVLLKSAFLVVGLSGGESSVFGVMLISAFDGSSDSFSNLSKIGPRTSLSGESDMTVRYRMRLI